MADAGAQRSALTKVRVRCLSSEDQRRAALAFAGAPHGYSMEEFREQMARLKPMANGKKGKGLSEPASPSQTASRIVISDQHATASTQLVYLATAFPTKCASIRMFVSPPVWS
jgi:hypothetical protein